MTENSDGNQTAGAKPWQFQPGQSGNPSGKPKGARHAITLAAEALLDGETEALTRKCIELAKEGDMVAMRLCLERILPARKSRSVKIELPATDNAGGVAEAFSAVVAAVAAGDLALDEGSMVAGMLEMKRKALETADLERRIAAIEARQNGK